MHDGVAGESGEPRLETGAQSAPVDERVARLHGRVSAGVLGNAFPWLALLAGVAVLQRMRLHWIMAGQPRLGLQLALLFFGLTWGAVTFAHEHARWVWPPEGTRFHRRNGLLAADLAHGWWQYLWLSPLLTVLTVTVAALVVLGIVRPGEASGVVYAADLAWDAILAGVTGGVAAAALLRPRMHAITVRGVHTSALSFAPWRELSHALVEPEERVIRLYSRRRPWLPRTLLAYRNAADTAIAADLIAPYLPCYTRDEEPPVLRRRWSVFLGGLILVVAVATLGVVGLLLVPETLLSAAGAVGAAPRVASFLEQMTDLVFAVALLVGFLLDSALGWLRGITSKKVVSEGA